MKQVALSQERRIYHFISILRTQIQYVRIIWSGRKRLDRLEHHVLVRAHAIEYPRHLSDHRMRHTLPMSQHNTCLRTSGPVALSGGQGGGRGDSPMLVVRRPARFPQHPFGAQRLIPTSGEPMPLMS